MAVRTKEELLEIIKNRIGEDTSDDAISLIEDISDTYDSLNTSSNDEEWKQKLKDLDESWRKKYKDRFFKASDIKEDEEIVEDANETKEYSYEKLFVEGDK